MDTSTFAPQNLIDPMLPFKFDNLEPRLHVSRGNVKTGAIPSFNLVPGDGYEVTRDGHYIAPVFGTCKGVCDGCKSSCYARRIYRMQRPTIVRAWAENTLLARLYPFEFQTLMRAWLKENEPRYFRLHVSGEFDNWTYFKIWVNIARWCRGTIFYTYTKRTDFLERYERDYGRLPDNFVIQVSMWHDTVENPTGAPAFIYDDGTEDLEHIPHCPAVAKPKKPGTLGHKTGVTCQQCKRCMKVGKGAMTAVYAH